MLISWSHSRIFSDLCPEQKVAVWKTAFGWWMRLFISLLHCIFSCTFSVEIYSMFTEAYIMFMISCSRGCLRFLLTFCSQLEFNARMPFCGFARVLPTLPLWSSALLCLQMAPTQNSMKSVLKQDLNLMFWIHWRVLKIGFAVEALVWHK